MVSFIVVGFEGGDWGGGEEVEIYAVWVVFVHVCDDALSGCVVRG